MEAAPRCYWRHPVVPVMTMHPVQDENRMEWKVSSVRLLGEGIFRGRFILEIEDRELCKQCAQITQIGSKIYERRDPTAMRRFLHALTNHLEEVMFQAKIRVDHQEWVCLSDWVSFGEVNEGGRLPVNVRLPGVDTDSGASLKCELKSAENMLIAQVAFEYLGEHGPCSSHTTTDSSLDVRMVDQLLGSIGSQQVMTAMRLSMGLTAKPITIHPAAKTEWLRKKHERPYWMNQLPQDWDDLKLFIPVLQLLAAGALPDKSICTPSYHPLETEKYTEDGRRGFLQSAEFTYLVRGKNWLTVSIERKLLEAKKQKDGPAVEPGIIMLKLTVKKGGAEPALVLCNGHSAKLLLANYLVRNSFFLGV